MSVEELIQSKSIMEEKLSLVKIDELTYDGKYPLQPYREGMRGAYGGEFLSQGLLATWQTVPTEEFSPHSLHSYFLKAGNPDSVMRWKITNTSDGRNYCNRMAQGFQSATGKLCFVIITSFTKNNSIDNRKIEFNNLSDEEKHKSPVPFEFQRTPQYFFDKYLHKIDELPYLAHTNGLIKHVLPNEFFQKPSSDSSSVIGMQELGMFVKILDDPSDYKDPYKTKFLNITYLSDSFYLSLLTKAIGLVFSEASTQFFRVSLDHSIHFHDDNFDPHDWLFLDFRFSRMSNNRVLCQCQMFTRDGRMVISIQQEALVFVPKKFIDKANRSDGYKL